MLGRGGCFNHNDLHPCVEQAEADSKKSGGFIKLFMRRGISVMIVRIKPAIKISTSYHLAEMLTLAFPPNADLLSILSPLSSPIAFHILNFMH